MIERWPYAPYLDEARAAATAYGVPASLVLAVAGVESAFNPNAYREEVAINDASRGLMQLLYRTARGLGYTGDEDGLFAPSVSLRYGAKLLRDNMRARSGNISDAISMYNGGYRPSLGFGATAKTSLTVCLARNDDGECINSHVVRPGEYANDIYVGRVLAAQIEFERALVSPSEAGAVTLSTGLAIAAAVVATLFHNYFSRR